MFITPVAPLTTSCSNCRVDVRLDDAKGSATVKVPGNGRRGSLHVPAHDAVADLGNDGDLLFWDCPVCEHADSYDLTA